MRGVYETDTKRCASENRWNRVATDRILAGIHFAAAVQD
jgi:hypothetical protein